VLDEGDIFLGGAGNDQVTNYNYGTFYGGRARTLSPSTAHSTSSIRIDRSELQPGRAGATTPRPTR
jgi:hypothetical protein